MIQNALIALCLLLVAAVGTQTIRLGHAQADAAKTHTALVTLQRDNADAVVAAELKADVQDKQKQEALAGAEAQYEKDKIDAQKIADRTIADLRAGNIRLRARWDSCHAAAGVPSIAAAAGQPDAAASDRDASASRIVRAASTCDAQVRGLQAVVRADRGVP